MIFWNSKLEDNDKHAEHTENTQYADAQLSENIMQTLHSSVNSDMDH